MFSKSKPETSSESNLTENQHNASEIKNRNVSGDEKFVAPLLKSAPSILSTDLSIKGNLKTSGDLQVEGKIEGNIKAYLLTVGQGALIKGEILAEEIIVNGEIIGTLVGTKIYLSSSAKVKGDIVHKTIAIENGAIFEGSIKQSDDPLTASAQKIQDREKK
jgi:cytoskeletal protein CcmA (bactofilin family)